MNGKGGMNMDQSSYMTAEQANRKWAFEISPPPIPDSEIVDRHGADVIVVGEGFSGLCTALSALESGLSVTIVTGSSRPVGRGGSVFAAYSKVMEREGYPRHEVEDFYLQEFAASGFLVDQRKWYSFFNHSEEAMNWLIDKLEARGYGVVLEDMMDDDPASPSFQPVGTHSFTGNNVKFAGLGIFNALRTLEEEFLVKGGTVVYKTPARRLLRAEGDSGRVCGLIARSEDGTYHRFDAAKAVVLASGDFSANKEMMAKYCPAYAKYFNNKADNYDVGFTSGGLLGGEGHLMALWAGAAWQRTIPNAIMIQGSPVCSHLPYGSHRGLRLNKNGERYCNEDMNAPYTALTVMREPDETAYAIWGTNYAYDLPWRFHGGPRGQANAKPEDVIARWEKDVKAGGTKRGNSILSVVEQLGVPVETTMAEIERYNAFRRDGYDPDFHKKAKYLTEIREGPFYGSLINQFWYFTVLGGPRSNHHMQICDEHDLPLGGLYSVGSMVGDMFSGCYNFRIAGHNYGSSLTFGYLTGKYIAEHE